MSDKRELNMPCIGYYQSNGLGCDEESLYWICSNHRDRIFLKDNGYMICEYNKCSALWSDWRFSCHRHPGEFISVSGDEKMRKKLINVLHTFLSQLYEKDEDFAYLRKIKQNLK